MPALLPPSVPPVPTLVLAVALLTATMLQVSAAPIISEFSAAGQSHVTDDRGDYPDWLELHHAGEEPHSLTGHYLTDDPDHLTKWRFPLGQIIRGGEHLLVFASRQDRTNIFQAAIHTNFALESSGGYLALVAPDGETVLHAWENYPRQRTGISFGIGRNGKAGYLAESSPGQPNGDTLTEIVADTKFSVDRGFHTRPFTLTITTATEGAVIYHTLDGSDPGPENGTRFTQPIAIDRTTVVRARAVKEGMISTDIDTHTYLYLAGVLDQPEAPGDFPPRWGAAPADYAFDRSVASEGAFERALLDYPSVSLVMPMDSWFHPSSAPEDGGIYANPLGRGAGWERAVSAEFLNFPGSENAQIDCGIRVYGNASRQPSRPKHNLRLAFRSRYGPAKLDFPVFGEDGVTGINGLLFNGQNGDSWFHPALAQREAASYIRDHFAHEVLGEMGHLTPPHGRAHLYINGLYWGFYQTVERVDQHFMARVLGGEPEEYDVMKASIAEGPTLVAGNTKAYETVFGLANDGLDSPETYAEIQNHLNLDSFIDYMLLNFWSGNRDWDHNNWRSGRHRSVGSPWHYFMWDSENIFKDAGIDRTGNNTDENPTRLHTQLARNSEYRIKFADRVQKHLFNGGVLSEESVKSRWKRWADHIRPGLVAESARWGDHHRPGNPHTVEEDFEAAYQSLMTSLFPARARNARLQFENRDLYPADIQPVDFSRHGGLIEPGFKLAMSAGSIFQPQEGEILFTLDGTDPREAGLPYSTPISLEATTTVKARVRDPSGRWSPLTEAPFFHGRAPRRGDLLISEIHYHPAAPGPAENPDGIWSATDYEFIEVWNVSADTLQLHGIAFTAGVRFTFPAYSLAAGERLLAVEDVDAFASRYGTSAAVAGAYRGNLSNGGEQLTLTNVSSESLHAVRYDDEAPWPAGADGKGPSLILTNATADAAPGAWAASSISGGSPGRGDGPGLPAHFSNWLTARDTADPLERDPRTGRSYLITYALDLDRPGTGSGIVARPGEWSVKLRTEAADWIISPEGSVDLETWTADPPGLTPVGAAREVRHWRLTEEALPYHRVRVSLP